VYFAPQGETVMIYVYGAKKLKRVPLSDVRLRRAERRQANNLVREPARPTNKAHRRAEIARRKHTDSMTKKDIKKRQEARLREAHGYTTGLEINEAAARLYPHNCAVIERTANGVSVGACAHYLRNGTDCPRHGRVKAYDQTLPPEGAAKKP